MSLSEFGFLTLLYKINYSFWYLEAVALIPSDSKIKSLLRLFF